MIAHFRLTSGSVRGVRRLLSVKKKSRFRSARISFRALMMLVIISLFTIVFGLCSAQSDCQRLAVCVLRKCSKVESPTTLRRKELLSGVLSQLNFACIFGPGCYDACSACRECSLMQEKIRRAVLREVPDSKCQQMDDCIRSCIRDDTVDPYGCIFRERCAPLCMEIEGCPSCYSVMQRIFTGVCYRHGLADLFDEKCRPLFQLLAKDLAAMKSWWR